MEKERYIEMEGKRGKEKERKRHREIIKLIRRNFDHVINELLD